MLAFIARNRRELPDFDFILDLFYKINTASDNTEVIVLRGVLFFYTEQKTTLNKIKEYYTPKAIAAFEADGYIKINYG